MQRSPCPSCLIRSSALADIGKTKRTCPSCGGEGFSFSLLRNSGQKNLVAFLEGNPKKSAKDKQRPCLDCGTPMLRTRVPPRLLPVDVDYCLGCRLLWLDPGEAHDAFLKITSLG
jgi:Zn-finger nucleic acid-binding protein